MDASEHESFSTFLSALLGTPSPTPLAVDSPLMPIVALQEHQDQTGPASVQASLGRGSSGCSGVGVVKVGQERKRDNSNRGNQGRRLNLLRLTKQLNQHQEEHRQQLRRNIYLTTRVAMLELLANTHSMNEAVSKQVRAGLTYNPFAAYDTTVEEFLREGVKPMWFVQRFQQGVQIMAGRLASCMPLVQKYPHLATDRPPMHILEQLRTELSLAEPTNPYGADGFATGTLTIPIPESIIQRLYAAYGMTAKQLQAFTRAMLESFATLILEQVGCSKACAHAYTVYPSIFNGDAVRLDASICNSSWEDLMTVLSKVQLDEPAEGAKDSPTSALVAPKAHWQNVVKSAGLTNKQKLQTYVMWEILGSTQHALRLLQAQLASQLMQVSKPKEKQSAALAVQPQQLSVTAIPEAMVDQLQWQFQADGLVGDSPPAGSSAESAAVIFSLGADELLKQEAIMQRLNDTVNKERHLKYLVAISLYCIAFGPIQETKVFALSHPYMPAAPDILAVCAEEYTPAVMDALVDEACKGDTIPVLPCT